MLASSMPSESKTEMISTLTPELKAAQERLLAGAFLFLFDRDDTLQNKTEKLVGGERLINLMRYIQSHHVWAMISKGGSSYDVDNCIVALKARNVPIIPELYTLKGATRLQILLKDYYANFRRWKFTGIGEFEDKAQNQIFLDVQALFINAIHLDRYLPNSEAYNKWKDQNSELLKKISPEEMAAPIHIRVGHALITFTISDVLNSQSLRLLLNSRKPFGMLDVLDKLQLRFPGKKFSGATISYDDSALNWPEISMQQIVGVDDELDNLKSYNEVVKSIGADTVFEHTLQNNNGLFQVTRQNRPQELPANKIKFIDNIATLLKVDLNDLAEVNRVNEHLRTIDNVRGLPSDDRNALSLDDAQEVGIQHLCIELRQKLLTIPQLLALYDSLKFETDFQYLRSSFKLVKGFLWLPDRIVVGKDDLDNYQSEIWVQVVYIIRKAIKLNLEKLKGTPEKDKMQQLVNESAIVKEKIPTEIKTEDYLHDFLEWDGEPPKEIKVEYKNH